MNRNSNLSPLPWYETIEEQGFRKHWAYGNVWPLIAHRDYLLPFQIVFPDTPSGTKFFIHQVESGRSFEITAAMSRAMYDTEVADYIVGVFPAAYEIDWSVLGVDFNNDFDESFGGEDHTSIGRYYLSMEYTLGGETKTMYSEVMTLVDDLSCFLKLEWFSYDNLAYNGGEIVYTYAFSHLHYANYLYIKADIAMPDYTFEEEGEERDGFFFATKQTSEKTYRFSFLTTEEICDALRIVGLSDVVSITDQWGRRYICDKFSMTPEWQQQGYLAAVNCEFQTDTVVIRRSVSLGSAPLRVFYRGDIATVNAEDSEMFIDKKGGVFYADVYPSVVSASASSWITAEVIDKNTVKFTVSENTTGALRSGSVSVTGSQSSRSFGIDQYGS